MPEPAGGLYGLQHDAIIPLYTLDLNPIGYNQVYRFCNYNQINLSSVRFQGQDFTAIPIEVSGFEISGSNERQPTPTITVSNVFSTITALALAYQDLRGAKFIRQRTFAKHLDNGSQPDGSKEFARDIYYVERKATENKLTVTFELRTSIEYGLSAKLPKRQMFHSLCSWRYRSSECGYTGGPVADINDNPTSDPALDQCGLKLSSCRLRFGRFAELPYGGFPGIDGYRD